MPEGLNPSPLTSRTFKISSRIVAFFFFLEEPARDFAGFAALGALGAGSDLPDKTLSAAIIDFCFSLALAISEFNSSNSLRNTSIAGFSDIYLKALLGFNQWEVLH